MDESAINAIANLAVEAAGANRLATHKPALIVGGRLESLEWLQAGRSRFRGAFHTSALSEFAAYVKAYPNGIGFIDPKVCAAQVYLNLGTPEAPGHADWTATLALEPTAAYAAIRAIEGRPQSQKQMVEWVEDWSAMLECKFGAASEPSGISNSLLAIRNLTISAKSDVTHTDKDFGASRSALEDIEAKAAGGIPSHLVFTCDPYAGFQQRAFLLRLSVITGDKPAFVLRTVSRESIEEDIAQEFKSRVLEEIGEAATMTIGGFKP